MRLSAFSVVAAVFAIVVAVFAIVVAVFAFVVVFVDYVVDYFVVIVVVEGGIVFGDIVIIKSWILVVLRQHYLWSRKDYNIEEWYVNEKKYQQVEALLYKQGSQNWCNDFDNIGIVVLRLLVLPVSAWRRY